MSPVRRSPMAPARERSTTWVWPSDLTRRSVAAALAVGLALALSFVAPIGTTSATANDLDIDVVIPEVAEGPFQVSNAELRWSLNVEAGAGAFFGGCNFLSAGVVGDTQGGKVWGPTDPFYSSSDGATTIEKPYLTSSGGYDYREVPFADRCLGPDGAAVRSSVIETTGAQAVLTDGVGSIDPDANTAEIAWEGAFTVVFYGGLTYWWVIDPYITVENGRGQLRGTAGGYGTDMADMSTWVELSPRDILLADLPAVDLSGATGFIAQPSYDGVRIQVPDGVTPQLREGSSWGSFPQAFVDFQVETGQAAYWYTSGGIRDAAKPALPVYVNYDADNAPAPAPPPLPDLGAGGDGGVLPPWGPSPGLPPGSGGVLPPSASGTGSGAGAGTGSGTGSGAGGSGQSPTPATPGGANQNNSSAEDDDQAVAAGPFRAALATQSIWPSALLIPAAVAETWSDPRTRTLIALSGLFGLGSAAVLGFRRGWLVWPWGSGGSG